ncbi:uncharacterized protein BDW47DRAFT_121900 [Aspergillus candidus]|uniref:Uncharacterized protein n=1 Tax=Aspergillus candidus TaxID=41067 RepID=A0A2I2FN97_ASPCN|nr:hypothetical protein BDW47DRAFT_121900 [Aspergillus candidus]PLB42110.1 hypothetical protein BDW47DRAFT_121900 [Aspergillus candidus]
MPFWRKRPRWPPSPSVEDEVESLSRELSGLSMLGEKPGVEGVCARGTVDQYPVLLEVPSFVSITQSFPWEDSGRCGSSDDSAGPPTPPLVAKQDPIFNVAGSTDMPGYTLDSVPVSAPVKTGSMTPQNRSRESSRARPTPNPKLTADSQAPVARQQRSKSKGKRIDSPPSRIPHKTINHVSIPQWFPGHPSRVPDKTTDHTSIPQQFTGYPSRVPHKTTSYPSIQQWLTQSGGPPIRVPQKSTSHPSIQQWLTEPRGYPIRVPHKTTDHTSFPQQFT